MLHADGGGPVGKLEGLLDAYLGERVHSGAGLTERVAGIPDHFIEIGEFSFGTDEIVDDGVAPVGARGDQGAGRNDGGDLGAEQADDLTLVVVEYRGNR